MTNWGSIYGVTPKSLHNWKAQFLENASLAFEPAKALSEYKETIKNKEEQIDELHKQLGKATVRAEFAEKEQRRPKNASIYWGPRRELGLIK